MRSPWSVIVLLAPLAACGPDLRIESVTAPEVACVGDDIAPDSALRVQNLGEDDITDLTHVGWYLSADDVWDDGDLLLVGGRDQIASIAALESVDVDLGVNQIPDTATRGSQFLIVVVDETDVVEEANEDNNELALEISIGGAVCGEVSTERLTAGGRQTCALSDAGTVRCWGDGEYGVLGYGNTDDIGDDETPASAGDVPLGEMAVDVEAGFYHTCAILSSGAVRCWGRNDSGQLGLGNTDNVGDDETPDTVSEVPVGGNVVQLAAGVFHTCALLDTGAVRCWGDGLFGQLGYGNTDTIGDDEPAASAGDVPLGGTAVSIEAGEFHTCAVMSTGDVRCWGGASSGMLGILSSTAIGDDETAESGGPVTLGGAADGLALGSVHTCARLTTGAVRCWGKGDRLGYGGTDDIGDDETPASAGDVPVGASVDQVSAGGEHTCALTTAGTVRCWGFVVAGGLGYGTTAPVAQPDLAGDIDVGGTVGHLASGYGQICALLDTGAVRCWGNGNAGRLGYGNTNAIGDDETPASAGDVPIW